MPTARLVSGLTRRRLASALALSPVVARPARAAAPSITFAGYGGWFQTAFDASVLEPFRKAHPDIRVFYYPVGNAGQALTMLREQRAAPQTDVVLLDTGVAATATAAGLLTPLTAADLPVIKDLIPAASRPDSAGPVLMLDNLALGYNPGRLAQTPRSWRFLWNPVHGRGIALQTPPDPLGLAITAVSAALYGGGDPNTNLTIAMTAMAQLVPLVAVWNPIPDVYTTIALGDATLGPCWGARGQAQAAMTPEHFAAVIPEEGSPYLATTINLVKGSPQAPAARTLIAWLLGPEGQRLLVETMFYAPVNPRAAIPPEALARAGASPAMVARRMEMDWVSVTAMREQITAAWRARDMGG